LSIPTVATGTPEGICIVDNKASKPFNLTSTGTPMTGLSVKDAMNPGRAADNPAIAIKTSASEFFTISFTFSGSH